MSLPGVVVDGEHRGLMSTPVSLMIFQTQNCREDAAHAESLLRNVPCQWAAFKAIAIDAVNAENNGPKSFFIHAAGGYGNHLLQLLF
jgi:hypothetical protein